MTKEGATVGGGFDVVLKVGMAGVERSLGVEVVGMLADAHYKISLRPVVRILTHWDLWSRYLGRARPAAMQR